MHTARPVIVIASLLAACLFLPVAAAGQWEGSRRTNADGVITHGSMGGFRFAVDDESQVDACLTWSRTAGTVRVDEDRCDTEQTPLSVLQVDAISGLTLVEFRAPETRPGLWQRLIASPILDAAMQLRQLRRVRDDVRRRNIDGAYTEISAEEASDLQLAVTVLFIETADASMPLSLDGADAEAVTGALGALTGVEAEHLFYRVDQEE